MNNFLMITFLICNLMYGKEEKYISNWEKRASNLKVSNENHESAKDSLNVPFVWSNIACTIIDSLAIKGSTYDSLLTVHKDSLDKYLPEPVELKLPNVIVVYGRKETVYIRNCKYEAHFFLLNEGEIFKESDCFEFCYIKGIGIVACTHLDTSMAPGEYERYTLTDIKDKNGRSIVNKKVLKLMISKLNRF